MMRLVFLFSAEERELLLLGDPLYDRTTPSRRCKPHCANSADQLGEEVLERRHDAWGRLLATFPRRLRRRRAPRLAPPGLRRPPVRPRPLPVPRRAARRARPGETHPAQPLPINNRTVLHLLEALQVLQVKVPGGGPAEARRLSLPRPRHRADRPRLRGPARPHRPPGHRAGPGPGRHQGQRDRRSRWSNWRRWPRRASRACSEVPARTRRDATPSAQKAAGSLAGRNASVARDLLAACDGDATLWRARAAFRRAGAHDTFG